MRSAAGFLVLLALGSGSLARAQAPAPAASAAPAVTASAAPATSAPASTGSATVATTDAPAAAVAPADAAPTAGGGKEPAKPASITVVADPMALTPEEKEFLSRGYKLEIRQETKFFCRREQELGSRFEKKTCSTGDALRAQQASAEEALRRIQSNRPTINN